MATTHDYARLVSMSLQSFHPYFHFHPGTVLHALHRAVEATPLASSFYKNLQAVLLSAQSFQLFRSECDLDFKRTMLYQNSANQRPKAKTCPAL